MQKNTWIKSSIFFILSSVLLHANAAKVELSTAVATDDNDVTCQSAGTFSEKLLTGVCWECMFPIKIGGVVISGTKSRERIPDGASEDKAMCVCYDNLGVPEPGIPSAFWEPYRLAEYTVTPGCSQVLLGNRFPFDRTNVGAERNYTTVDGKVNKISFRHYHYYSFPVLVMLSMYVPEKCNPGYFNDLDVMYLSEVDPTWEHSEMAFFSNPESALFANPLTAMSCIPDAFATMMDEQFSNLWWCAGSWGTITPPSGFIQTTPETLTATSRQLVRTIYQLHHRGLEWGTVGEANQCGGNIQTILPKSQYRFSLFHPTAEADDNHILGRSALFWGPFKLVAGLARDPVYVVWRWVDCCAD